MAYVANWHFLFSGRSYTALFSQPSPLEHFWSLAIEEQFYVVFPLLLLGLWKLGRGRRSVVAIALGAATIASVGLSIANAHHIDRVYYGTDTRAAELLIGALLALVFTWWSGPRTTWGRGALGSAGVGALVLLGWWWATVDQSDAWLYRGGFALHAVVVAVVITAASAPTVVSAGLSLAPLAALGRISYGVYLYHWPIFLWLSPDRVTLPSAELFALRVGVTIACATASFVFIEEPIRTGRSLRGAWPRIVAPVAVAALVAGVVSVTAVPPPPEINLQPIASTAVRPQTAAALPARVADTLAVRNAHAIPAAPPSTRAPAALPPPPAFHRATPPGRPLRVLVVGDSVGITLGRGLSLWSNATGRAVVDDAARKWCSLGRNLPRIAGIGTSEQGPGCDGWATRWARLRDRFDPDVVVVLYTIWEVVPRQLPGQAFTGVRDAAHARWQSSEYQSAADVLGAGGAKVVWLTIPCAGNRSYVCSTSTHRSAPSTRSCRATTASTMPGPTACTSPTPARAPSRTG
jgi:hypothetical protein